MQHQAPESRVLELSLCGKTLRFETGQVARQANGAVFLRVDETVVFATACASPEPLKDVDFLPLRVDYQEKFASAGKTPGGFIKREGRPAEREILTSRLIDRPIRPLFPDGYYHDVQLLAYVLSYDGTNAPDVYAICAASAALCLSDIPFPKPLAAVRVGYINEQFVVNPSVAEQKTSKLDLVLAGTADAILMIEGYCDFLTEDELLKAIETGHKAIADICHGLAKWQKELGKTKKPIPPSPIPHDLAKLLDKELSAKIAAVMRSDCAKAERDEKLSAIKDAFVLAHYTQEEAPKEFGAAFKNLESSVMRAMILKDRKRADGRALDEVRPIWIQQSMLPRTHGSSLFTRGETQSLAICTLGGESMAQRYEDLNGESAARYYLQYFFPPFCVGEVGRIGSPGRREVGHGKLAERALAATIPSKETFPYTIRLESNITESNGSSSMASVCGGCLAMMDAGVPIKRPIAGIAMGLVLEKSEFAILSDILGLEDHLGDMDFKVTGDADGVTAFQMDIKVEGITIDIMRAALAQAKKGRIHILEQMLKACPQARQELSPYAPRVTSFQIKPSKIGTVVGPGGKQIRAIIEETGVEIDIQDDGTVNISGRDPKAVNRAKEIVASLTAEVEIGKTYRGPVRSVVPFGVFVEILPGKEGLCHISELDIARIEDITGYIKEGEEITVKVIDINERGQMKLSRKVLLAGGDTGQTKASNSSSRGERNERRPPRRDHHKKEETAHSS